MTKVESLVENYSYLKLSLIDIIKLVDPSGKSKYVELIHKLGPKNRIIHNKKEADEVKDSLNFHYGISNESISKYDDKECGVIYYLLDRFFNSSEIKMLQKLHDFSNRNLIENFDISKINSYEDIANLITLAEIKKSDKESEKMCKILLKNDNWLVLRPLTHKASLKYGASTKWCTVSEKEPTYFVRYIKRGILIYIINMKTGNKTAFFHSIEDNSEKETSFWNVVDTRIDSIETDLTQEVLDIIRDEMKEKISNWSLLNDEEKLKIEFDEYGKLISIEEVLRNMPEPLEIDTEYRPAEPANAVMNIPTMRG